MVAGRLRAVKPPAVPADAHGCPSLANGPAPASRVRGVFVVGRGCHTGVQHCGGIAGRPESPAACVLAGCAFAMVLNVVAPYCIATRTLRQCMPGTATALLFSLPLGGFFLAQALSENFIQLKVFTGSARPCQRMFPLQHT